MHITLESDYAVRIVSCLARQGGRMDAKRIAEETGVTLRFSLKILRKLVTGGLVRSYKGTKGGYELARPAKDISLCDVIETVEGPYALSRCVGSRTSGAAAAPPAAHSRPHTSSTSSYRRQAPACTLRP